MGWRLRRRPYAQKRRLIPEHLAVRSAVIFALPSRCLPIDAKRRSKDPVGAQVT
jgi:hypothetical protein